MRVVEWKSAGLSFEAPASLQAREKQEDGRAEIALADLRDPRNYFGYRVVLQQRPLAADETLAAALLAQLASLQRGAAKRDFREVRRAPAQLAGLAGEEIAFAYVLDAGRVEYTDPDGRSRSAGDATLPIAGRLVGAQRGRDFVAAWLLCDEARQAELGAVFDGIVRSLKAR
jgi:hypothetical protein